nr:uncharacterized protein LOC109769775 [Aegilops tauschii subsp. strangulata]
MAYQALSELKPGVKNWNVCVHVSHLWKYRGGTDIGPVQHVDMVLVNNKIHGVACHTIVEAVADIQDGFLEFVYDPIPFLDLAAYVGENKRFVHQLLKFIAKFSKHPNGKVLLWKMGIARVLNKLLKNCSNASYLEDKAISERGAYRSDQLMLKWRIPLFRCLASIFSAQPSGKEQTAIEESSENASVEECSSIMHHLLVLCQALPIFLDRIFNPVLAIILSVTFVLAFGEVMHLMSRHLYFCYRPTDYLIDHHISTIRLYLKQYVPGMGWQWVLALFGSYASSCSLRILLLTLLGR